MAGHCPDSIPARDLGDHSYFAYLVVDDVDGTRGVLIVSTAAEAPIASFGASERPSILPRPKPGTNTATPYRSVRAGIERL